MSLKTLKIFFLIILTHVCSAQNQSEKEKHDKATENIADVLFDSKAKPIRDRTKAFENANGIKLHYRVEDQSLDKLGGLSEHLFKLFQTFTSPVNTNAKTITAEFSALNNNVLSDILTFKTNATNDLCACVLPLKSTQKLDSLYNKFLHGGSLTQEDINNVPENLDGLYSQTPYDYEKILAQNTTCPGIFDANSYAQHVLNTRQGRKNNWTADANALSLSITGNFFLLSNNGYVNANNNPGNTGINLNIQANLLKGSYVLNLNNSVNTCTEKDMEVRCKMLFRKTNINFLFVTQTLNYYLPIDSLNTFRDVVTKSLETNYSDKNLIIALWLKMVDPSTGDAIPTLLVKQNGSWLTTGDINFATYNNGGEYKGGTFYKFKNIYKNIPKPLILCYQVAKVNGLLTTTYFNKAQAIKGRDQIYYHVFKTDKAFEEIKQLSDQLSSLYQQSGGTGGSLLGTTGNINPQIYKDIDNVRNKIKVAYIKAAKNPAFNEASVHFKELYLQDGKLVHQAGLKHLSDKYGLLYKNNQLGSLLSDIDLPSDLEIGQCKEEGTSDVVADVLNVSSLLLSPTGLDIIPDALSVAYYASTDQTYEMMWATASFLVPGSLCGAKKLVSNSSDAIKEINAGSKLIKEGGQYKAIQQDNNLMTSMFNINPANVNAGLVTKINNNPTAINELLPLSESQSKLYSNVSSKLEEPKRIEFLNKAIDDVDFRQKVLKDPDEVLRWAGVYGKWIDDLETIIGAGTKNKLVIWINKGLNETKLEAAFNKSTNKANLLNNLESSKSIFHQRVHIEDWDNIPGITKTSYSPNGLNMGKNYAAWNNAALDLPLIDAANFVNAVAGELPSGTKIYRVTGGNPAGAYWTIQKPNSIGEVIGGTAVRPEWNSFEKMYVYEVPPGQTLKVWKGSCAKQSIKDAVTNPHLPGGAQQIFIPDIIRNQTFANLIQQTTLPW